MGGMWNFNIIYSTPVPLESSSELEEFVMSHTQIKMKSTRLNFYLFLYPQLESYFLSFAPKDAHHTEEAVFDVKPTSV